MSSINMNYHHHLHLFLQKWQYCHKSVSSYFFIRQLLSFNLYPLSTKMLQFYFKICNALSFQKRSKHNHYKTVVDVYHFSKSNSYLENKRLCFAISPINSLLSFGLSTLVEQCLYSYRL